MGGEGQNIILIVIIIAVVLTVAAWLIHFIMGIRKTQKAYREIMEKKREESPLDTKEEAVSGKSREQTEKNE